MIFGLFPRLYVYAALAGLALIALGWTVYSIRKDARDDVIRSIEQSEYAARRKAVEGARSVDACHDNGGVWSRSTGSCRLP